VPKSTFFYEPRQESPDSKRRCSKPGYSKTLSGAYISDEMIKTLLFDLAEEFPFFGYKKLTFLLRSRFGIIINKKKGLGYAKKWIYFCRLLNIMLLPILK
jgi:putative transposase